MVGRRSGLTYLLEMILIVLYQEEKAAIKKKLKLYNTLLWPVKDQLQSQEKSEQQFPELHN